jgi:hypothetical protein
LAVTCTAYGLTAPSFAGPENSPRQQQHENRAASNPIGGNSNSTERWNDVPRGTMDEVSSRVRLDPAVTVRSWQRLFRLVLESHDGRAPGADSEEKHEPVSDIETVVVDSLKALDPEWPIREADVIANMLCASVKHSQLGSMAPIFCAPCSTCGDQSETGCAYVSQGIRRNLVRSAAVRGACPIRPQGAPVSARPCR